MAIVHQCHCGVKLDQSTKELAYCGNNLLEQETVVILMPLTTVTNVMALFLLRVCMFKAVLYKGRNSRTKLHCQALSEYCDVQLCISPWSKQ